MTVDYFSLLTKAVAGKDAPERDKIYRDAYGVIARSNLTREASASHIAALEDAIRRIENGVADEETRGQKSAAEISQVLSTGRNLKPFMIGAFALVAAAVLSASLYLYLAPRPPSPAGVIASSSKSKRTAEDVIVADLKPGVDGGSSSEGLAFALQRQVVFYRTTIVPGSIVVDRENRFLYLIDGNNSARRYGIGIAQECLKGGSFFRVTNKLEWPEWQASNANTNTKDGETLLAAAGRPGSLLGARALLLDKPRLLIHGTNSPKTIGHLVASGCIRLVNEDVEDLYRRVSLETRVVFVS
jgi:lipoprotein-anchoring transpeptidase ErfK/SrfK